MKAAAAALFFAAGASAQASFSSNVNFDHNALSQTFVGPCESKGQLITIGGTAFLGNLNMDVFLWGGNGQHNNFVIDPTTNQLEVEDSYKIKYLVADFGDVRVLNRKELPGQVSGNPKIFVSLDGTYGDGVDDFYLGQCKQLGKQQNFDWKLNKAIIDAGLDIFCTKSVGSKNGNFKTQGNGRGHSDGKGNVYFGQGPATDPKNLVPAIDGGVTVDLSLAFDNGVGWTKGGSSGVTGNPCIAVRLNSVGGDGGKKWHHPKTNAHYDQDTTESFHVLGRCGGSEISNAIKCGDSWAEVVSKAWKWE